MNIRHLHLKGFMRHDETIIDLPPRGLILLTGPNGHGKSSILEGVSYGVWGETLRGTNPWRKDDTPLTVGVTTDALSIVRSRRKAKATLAWGNIGAEPTAYENTSKAQAALEAVVGDFKVWRWTSVFSSSDAALFTMADDASRKKLIERIIGLERFDGALAKCRDELRVAKADKAAAERSCSLAENQAQAEERRLTEAKESLALMQADPAATVGNLAEMKANYERLRKLAQSTNGDLADLRGRMQAAELAGKDELAEAREVDRRLAALAADNCPTCDQPIPEALRKALRDDAEAKRAEAQKKQAEARATLDAMQLEREELEEEKESIVGQAEAVKGQVSSHEILSQAAERAQEQRARFSKIIASAEAALLEIRHAVKTAGAEFDKAALEADTLEACERVLGLQGVRAQVLGKALAGIEAVANGWLSRIAGPGLTLRLLPYSETKTAGVNDKISLDVEGAGDGQGYKAASGGERRRIDIAILFALAEVARAAHGQADGTIFADEVFDALDSDGRSRLAEALRELAETTAVVVISHIRDLWEDLDPDMHLHVVEGRVQVVS